MKELELSIDGLDLRSFSSLKPLEQLDRLQRDCAALAAYEVEKRKADALLRAQSQKTTEKTR